MKLTDEQIDSILVEYAPFRYGTADVKRLGLRQALEKFLSPRPAPAQVTWRKDEGGNLNHPVVFSDKSGLSTGRRSDYGFYLAWEDLFSIPFPAEPTPEEQAEREFEALAIKHGYYLERNEAGSYKHHETRCFHKGFMAAKLSAGGKDEL